MKWFYDGYWTASVGDFEFHLEKSALDNRWCLDIYFSSNEIECKDFYTRGDAQDYCVEYIKKQIQKLKKEFGDG